MIKSFLVAVLLVLSLATAHAVIRTVYGGAVDATPNPLPPAPSSGSLVTTGGVYSVAINTSGLFAGITSTGVVKKSPTGAVWSNTPTQPADAPIGIQYIGSRILTISNNGGTNCVARYSDNGGTTWTNVNVISVANWRCLDGSGAKAALKCDGSTCYVGLHNSANGHIQIYTTGDSGASWSSAIGADSTVWLNGSDMYALSVTTGAWLMAPPTVGPDNSPINVGVYYTSGLLVLANGFCGATGTYHPRSGSSTILLGNCNSSTSVVDFLTSGSVSFSPTVTATSLGQAFTMTNVVPATTYVTGQATATLFGTIYTSTTGTSFSSTYSSGLGQTFGQFAPYSVAGVVALYVGSSVDRLYKVQ